MKKSNIFSGVEGALGRIENSIASTRDEYKYYSEKKKEIEQEALETDTKPEDNWQFENILNSLESKSAEIDFLEASYNYLYENFQKLSKGM